MKSTQMQNLVFVVELLRTMQQIYNVYSSVGSYSPEQLELEGPRTSAYNFCQPKKAETCP